METKKIEVCSWVRDVIGLPRTFSVNVDEIPGEEIRPSGFTGEHHPQDTPLGTRISISLKSRQASTLSIMKPISDVTQADIVALKASIESEVSRGGIFTKGLVRLFGWWFIFAGSLTVFSVCPMCGQVGCPVGLGITGIVAGLFAVAKQYGGLMLQAVRDFFRLR